MSCNSLRINFSAVLLKVFKSFDEHFTHKEVPTTKTTTGNSCNSDMTVWIFYSIGVFHFSIHLYDPTDYSSG